MTAAAAQTAPKEIVITRLIDAPRELVFTAWVEPEHIVHWYSAGEGWTTPFAESDSRPGGKFRIGFGSPDGKNDFVFDGTYKDVERPSRLSFAIADGRPVTVLFDDEGGKTRLTLTLALEDVNSEAQQRAGWTAIVDNLGKHLEINGRVVITRTLDAPAALVFRAWTDPAMLAAWFGPERFTVHACKVDARPGGKFSLTMRGPDGADYPMGGTYREVDPPHRLSFTNVPLDAEGKPLMQGFTTVTFIERGGKTELTMETVAAGLVPMAKMMLQGMNEGWSQSLDKLGRLLAKG